MWKQRHNHMVRINCRVEKKKKKSRTKVKYSSSQYTYYDWLVLRYKEFSKYSRKKLERTKGLYIIYQKNLVLFTSLICW